jgi:hypothetical protein
MASTTKGNIKNRLRRTHARDMDDMADSMVTLTDTAQTLTGAVTLSGAITNSYMDYLGGYQGNLATGITITDAEAVLGLATATAGEILNTTLTNNALNFFAGTNSAAGTMCYLPIATIGSHCALEITGEIDDTTNALPIKAVGAVGASANLFAKQSLMLNGTGATLAGRQLETAGTAAVPTTVNIIYTPAAAATNILGPGSMIHFYCPVDGQWLVKFNAVAKTTGVTGAITIS